MTEEQLQQQIQLIINANKIGQSVMDELTKLASRIASETHGFANLCHRCGAVAAGWLIATCGEEHVTTSRICAECDGYWYKLKNTRNCPTCNRMVWDWALKPDKNRGWTTNWPQDDLPAAQPDRGTNVVHLRVGAMRKTTSRVHHLRVPEPAYP